MPRTFVIRITAERNEINIKDSTAESQIKVLGQLQRFHNFKEFRFMTRGDILNHLDSLKYHKRGSHSQEHRKKK